VLYSLEMLEGMRCMLLCMLEAVEGEICLLEVEAIRCSLLYILEAMEDGLCLMEAVGGAACAEGDARCVTLYAGGCGWCALFAWRRCAVCCFVC